jgi:hypothetical protein
VGWKSRAGEKPEKRAGEYKDEIILQEVANSEFVLLVTENGRTIARTVDSVALAPPARCY